MTPKEALTADVGSWIGIPMMLTAAGLSLYTWQTDGRGPGWLYVTCAALAVASAVATYRKHARRGQATR